MGRLRNSHYAMAEAGDKPKPCFNVTTVPKATVASRDRAWDSCEPGCRSSDQRGADIVAVKDMGTLRAQRAG